MANQSISDALGLGEPPLATVLLGHELPDGSHHIDWMLARDSKNEQPMASFRVAKRLDAMAVDETLEAVRIQDHRPAYLEYEGEVSGNRGFVRRVCRGVITRWSEVSPGKLELEVHWSAGLQQNLVQHLALQAENPSQWLVNCVSIRRC
jgi:hypothetical protein